MSINTFMPHLNDAVMNKNWEEMSKVASKFKDSSYSVGAGKIHFACYYIISAYNSKDYASVEHHYQLIVEACLEFK